MEPQAASTLSAATPRRLRPVASRRDAGEALLGDPDAHRAAMPTRDGASPPPGVMPNPDAFQPTSPVPSQSRHP